MQLDERHLVRYWLAGLVNADDVRLADGRSLRVVYRGRRSHGVGPDFQRAILEIGGEIVRGDVELHLSRRDWIAHRHQHDPRYDDVVLHVVWEASPVSALTHAGREPSLLELTRLYSSVGAFARAIIAAPPPDEPYHEWVRLLDADDLGHFLDACGDRRFQRKSDRFEGDLTALPRDEIFYRALLDAAGYSQNRQPCAELAGRLPIGALEPLARRPDAAIAVESALLGAAGLLPTQASQPLPLDGDDEAANQREALWHAFEPSWGDSALDRASWHFLTLRPANTPPRRLAGAARLVVRQLRDDLLGQFADAVVATPGRAAWLELVRQLTTTDDVGYWSGRSDFGRPLRQPLATLIGPDRAADIAVNAVLPLLAAIGAADGDRALGEAAAATYAAAPPLSDNWVTREMVATVIGPERRRAARTARRQQGVLELYHSCCAERRCATCPFPQTAAAWRHAKQAELPLG